MSNYRIGDEVYIHGIIDEIRKDTIIIKNEGGYFGTVSEEIMPSAHPDGIPLEWINKHLERLDNCDNDFSQLAKVSIRAMVELWKKDRI